MPEIQSNQPLRWYQRVSGIIGIGLVITVLGLAIFFGGSVWYYTSQIKKGNGQILFNDIYGGFSKTKEQKNKTSEVVDRAELETSDDPSLGSANPKVTIVEFIDFKCPNSKAEAPIIREVIKKYGNKVKVITRNFPLESVYAGTNQLAIFATCASEQGYFWPVHDWLYATQEQMPENITDEQLLSAGVSFGMDEAKLKTCLNGSQGKIMVNKDFSDGIKNGVEGTPTFFINGKKVEGVVPMEVWDNFLSKI